MQVASVHHEYSRLTLATAGLLFYFLIFILFLLLFVFVNEFVIVLCLAFFVFHFVK